MVLNLLPLASSYYYSKVRIRKQEKSYLPQPGVECYNQQCRTRSLFSAQPVRDILRRDFRFPEFQFSGISVSQSFSTVFQNFFILTQAFYAACHRAAGISDIFYDSFIFFLTGSLFFAQHSRNNSRESRLRKQGNKREYRHTKGIQAYQRVNTAGRKGGQAHRREKIRISCRRR